jgi:hypothetical protein
MKIPWAIVLLSACSSLFCVPSTERPRDPRIGPGLLTHRAGGSGEALVFPPADTADRLPRSALPDSLGGADSAAPLRVTEPEVTDGGGFEFAGQTLRIVFNHPIALSSRGEKAAVQAAVRIHPAVSGQAHWRDERTLEFVAVRPFDPDTRYTLELGDLRAANGQSFAQPFKAEFKANVSLAGKVLTYLPKTGRPRVVVARPSSGSRVGRMPELSVLFDQPIDLDVAQRLIALKDQNGHARAIVLDHPKRPSYEGYVVDPRQVVLARPAVPLLPGQSYALQASDRFSEDGTGPKLSHFDVARPLEMEELGCGYGGYRSDGCQKSSGRIRTSEREVDVRFNNPISTSGRRLSQSVKVTPPVKGLSVDSYRWDGEHVLLRAAFESSTTYSVTIAGLKDIYGNLQTEPVRFRIETPPLPASVSMPAGILALDESTSRKFSITSRNVAKAELLAWPVSEDAGAFKQALRQARTGELPGGEAPVRVTIPIRSAPDRPATTDVNLLAALSADQSYVATVRISEAAFGAPLAEHPRGSEAARPPVALLTPGSAKTLAVHSQAWDNVRMVHVARMGTGEPVAGATIRRQGDESSSAVTTNRDGVAVLGGVKAGDDDEILEVRAGDTRATVALGNDAMSAQALFPHLASGVAGSATSLRAMILTDRGIYRPGADVWMKATVRKPEGDRLAPAAGLDLRVRVLGPTGDEVFSEPAVLNDMGSFATRFAVPAGEKVGRHRILLESTDQPDPPLADSVVQVAEFEPPRFAVDVIANDEKRAGHVLLRAAIRGRYLFGAPMDGADVSWIVKRRPAPFASGPFTDAGFSFRRDSSWWSDGDEDEPEAWSRAGEAKLDSEGTLKLEQALASEGTSGPQEFTVEADVSDSSNRHIAARASVVQHPADRYVGIRLKERWASPGSTLPVELGVVDRAGAAVAGAPISAQMEHIDWKYVHRRGPGGALSTHWTAERSVVDRCSVKSATTPVVCKLQVPRSGSYEVIAQLVGRPGGSAWFWAWGGEGEQDTPFPSRGHTVDIVTDRSSYAPGDTARLLVRNPYPAATAILTMDQGGLLEHREVRIEDPTALLSVPLSAVHAPHVHATVTLLPIGAKGNLAYDFRIGAVRLPVSSPAARLDVLVSSDKPTYRPGEEAEIVVEVKDGGKPKENAEIALAVVDEGVLRMTSFRAVDPVQALRPGRALSFHIADSRQAFAEKIERSHVAGDGGEAGMQTIDKTRKSFVETALWRPDLRTGPDGRAAVKVKLPDNLTEFRMMAVVLDKDGKGASVESAFKVQKPVMLVPIVPRFAALGDRFEAAAMLHNLGPQSLDAKVGLNGRDQSITVAPGGHTRVAFPVSVQTPDALALQFMAQDSGGAVLDRVEAKIPVEIPGIEEHPEITGAFVGRQEVKLVIPEGVLTDAGGAVTIQVGQHLFPELGARLGYLVEYPHGCVEQTTSGTLPLLALREILPRIGFTRFTDTEIKDRIAAGVARLHSMRTRKGGLGYWPGDDQPNVYGTAYAMRAMVLAQQSGIALPKGLLDGMARFLSDELLRTSIEPEVQAAIAQSLGELGQLPASASDALYDRRGEQSVFGWASLAIALSSLEGQDDRVAQLLDSVEKAFDEGGRLLSRPKANDFYYYGSETRTRAQAAMALGKLRPASAVLPRLVSDLSDFPARDYTTQATAWSLLAMAQHIGTTAAGSEVSAALDGKPLSPSRDLGLGGREFSIPVAQVRGKSLSLLLASHGEESVGFSVSARFRRPITAATPLEASRARRGPEIHRVVTDPKGGSVDLSRVHAGDLLRVSLLCHMPSGEVDRARLGYLAITDRLPAGFEPIEPDLATVASVPDLGDKHPFAELLRWGSAASHVELRDSRVQIYFDRVWDEYVAASYLVRATTPGDFILPPAAGELMYEPGSTGTTETARVIVQ